jgi:hypothetical protein
MGRSAGSFSGVMNINGQLGGARIASFRSFDGCAKPQCLMGKQRLQNESTLAQKDAQERSVANSGDLCAPLSRGCSPGRLALHTNAPS